MIGFGGARSMRIGIPKEIKNNENRVGLSPSGVHALVEAGHEVLVETAAVRALISKTWIMFKRGQTSSIAKMMFGMSTW